MLALAVGSFFGGLGLLLWARPCWPLMFEGLCGHPEARPLGLFLVLLTLPLLWGAIREARRAA